MNGIVRLKDKEYFVEKKAGMFIFGPQWSEIDLAYTEYSKCFNSTYHVPFDGVNPYMFTPSILTPNRIDTSVYISQSAIDSFKSATPRPAVKGKVIPDTVSTIKAYRAWRIRRKRLIPLYDNSLDTWQPMKAAVGNCSHQQISEECQCGIHAYKVPEHLCLELSGLASKNVVIGMVELWGRYLEFEDGWRAEFAYPTELWIVLPEHEEIAAEYGCKVREIRL